MRSYVSIHAPARGATSWGSTFFGGDRMFQSTHPRGVRPEVRGSLTLPSSRFNPRTREGCDKGVWYLPAGLSPFQSTHPRGVRPPICWGLRGRFWVSIHAPARGATMPWEHQTGRYMTFQSTHPRGVRLGGFDDDVILPEVSIHAPARGATFDIGLNYPSFL